MKLEQLRKMALFAMVAREGSFTAVAQQQNIATSAISNAITHLESDLSVRLLHRTTRKLRLTDEGRAFFKRCEAMLFEANAAHEEIAQLGGQLSGTLTIAVSNLEAQSIVLPALANFLQSHPKVVLNLLVNDQKIDLVAQGIDIAIRIGDLEDSSLIARPLGLFPEVLVAAPAYIEKYGEPNEISELSKHYIIAFLPFSQPNQISVLDKQGTAHSAYLKIAAKTDNVEVSRELAILGLGIARLPYAAVNNSLSRGKLVQVMKMYSLPKIQIYALTIKRDLQPLKVSMAIEKIQQYLNSVR